METKFSGIKPKYRTAFGILSVAAAMLFASIGSSNTLRAKQDEDSEKAQSTAGLRVPADIREEAIEKIDAAFAASAGPLLRTAFSDSESAESRKSAVAELKTLVSQFESTAPGAASLKNRLSRRISLLDAALAAVEVEDLTAGTAESGVASAATETSAWLSSIRNGELWGGYLHLSNLTEGAASLELLQKVSGNLTVNESINDAQRAFLQRPQLQSLKAAIDSEIAAKSYSDDETAARAELKRQVDHLVVSVLAYESQRLVEDAEHARSAYRSIRSRFPLAGEILRPVLVSSYFNHNLHITVSESLLSRLVADYRSESGCIADCIMGAWVTGSQITTVNVSADIVPSTNSAAFKIQADGNTQ